MPDLRDPPNNARKARAERQAINTVIQGSAADMCKLAMLRIRQRLMTRPDLNATVRIALQLHDEIILELPQRLISEVERIVREGMESIITNADVPFTININAGPHLGAMSEI